MMQFCKLCHSIMHNGTCTNRRCLTRNERLASWLIDGTLYRFRKPLTFTEAKKAVRDKDSVVIRFKLPKSSTVKPFIG